MIVDVTMSGDALAQENTGSHFAFRSESLSGLFRKFAAVLEKDSPVYTPLLRAILTEAIYEMTFAHGTQPAAAADKSAEKLRSILADGLKKCGFPGKVVVCTNAEQLITKLSKAPAVTKTENEWKELLDFLRALAI